MGIGLLLWITASHFIPSAPIFKRSEDAFYYFTKGDYNKSINRDFGKAIPIVVANSGFWGNGSFLISRINCDVMVFHNLFLGVYANYGVIGLLALFYLFLSNVLRLYRIISSSFDKQLVNASIVLLTLLFSLLFQQMKVSALRSISILLLYTFVFALINLNYSKFKEEIYGKSGN
jgi:hypothetical protein